jgi:hypothetical protein
MPDQGQIAAVNRKLEEIVEHVGALPSVDQFLSGAPATDQTEAAQNG